MIKWITASFLFISLVGNASGLTLGATRLIYAAEKKEASIPLYNQKKGGPYLIQSWVTDLDKNESAVPFIVTPPLFKMAASTDSSIRVVYVGGNNELPHDKESVYLLSVRAIPAVEKKDNPQRLTIAIQNVIKLIYRPAGLNANDAQRAGEKLLLTLQSKTLKLNNPTPYVISLADMTINGKKIDRPGNVLPFSSKFIPIDDRQIENVIYRTINDFGGLSAPREVKF